MPTVLGRVTAAEEVPRGPDVKLSIRVQPEWLEAGEQVEIELPRNLVCARCDGGGCDVCGGSGAISLRERTAQPEVVRVTLPMRPEATPPSSRRQGIAIRIPEYGGTAVDPRLPRGHLILGLVTSDEPDPSVRLAGSTMPFSALASGRPSQGTPRRGLGVRAVAVLVALWVMLLMTLRLLGLG